MYHCTLNLYSSTVLGQTMCVYTRSVVIIKLKEVIAILCLA